VLDKEVISTKTHRNLLILLPILYSLLACGGQNAQNLLPEPDLQEIVLTAYTDHELAEFFAGDYDLDGTEEAFALLWDSSEQVYKLVFVTDQACTLLGESMNAALVKWTVGDQALFCYTGDDGFAFTMGASVFSVKNSAPLLHENTGVALEQIGATNEFLLLATDLDSGIDLDTGAPIGGRNFRYYWLYWTGTDFAEYGGISITTEELRQFGGGAEVLAALTKEGAEIDEIYYRGNNIININYSIYENSTVAYRYRTLQCEGGAVEDVTSEPNGGHYAAAYAPERAVYPDSPPRSQSSSTARISPSLLNCTSPNLLPMFVTTYFVSDYGHR
jgi:hypothetical protein